MYRKDWWRDDSDISGDIGNSSSSKRAVKEGRRIRRKKKAKGFCMTCGYIDCICLKVGGY